MENLIKNLCREYELTINQDRGKDGFMQVKFINEKKPDGYWSKHQINGSKPKILETMAWHSEIWVNNLCVFRMSLIPINESEQEWDKVKKICQQRLFTDVFTYGMAAARQLLKGVKEVQ